MPVFPRQIIITCAPPQDIVTRTTDQFVIALHSDQLVIAGQTAQGIGLRIAFHQIGLGCATAVGLIFQAVGMRYQTRDPQHIGGQQIRHINRADIGISQD